jgi:putative nucleotidyltransferase with HDIG domain
MEQEKSFLTINSLFEEINTHLLQDNEPSLYLKKLLKEDVFKEFPFSLLYQLQFTKQSPVHHPEGNVWNHTLMVVDEAANRKNLSKEPRVFMWAALLHDIGKPATTKMNRDKITAYNHDKEGAKLAFEFLEYFNEDKDFIEKVRALVEFHMHILFVVKDMPFANVAKLLKQTDYKEVALLGLCDRLGRGEVSLKKEEDNVKAFLDKVGLYT